MRNTSFFAVEKTKIQHYFPVRLVMGKLWLVCHCINTRWCRVPLQWGLLIFSAFRVNASHFYVHDILQQISVSYYQNGNTEQHERAQRCSSRIL